MTSRKRNIITIFNESRYNDADLIIIRPGMIVAQDVYNDKGLLLCAKDTVLDDNKVDFLLDNGIRWANALPASDKQPYMSSISEDALNSSLVLSSESFKDFATAYTQKIDKVKEQLVGISDGRGVDISSLHNITNDIMGTLESKNDVFNYIRFMKQSDEATYEHCINVSMLCNLFGNWLGMKYNEVVELTAAGSLHDLGKTKISNEILCKKEKLSTSEFQYIKNHAVFGYELLKEMKHLPESVKLAALMHHEKLDGSGYPYGVKGSEISKYASIVTICDIYDAMISNRCYKEKLSPFHVIKTFEQGFYGYLHTEYLLVFLKNIAQTFLHSKVTLSDGREGVVVFINEKHLSRPIVQCGSEFVDLIEQADLNVSLVL